MDFPDIDNDYTAGSDPNAAWTDDANAWDGDSSTYAYRTLPTSSGKETTNYLLFSGNEAGIEDAVITAVRIYVSARRESATDVIGYVVPYFGGSDAGDEHIIPFAYGGTTTSGTEEIDITEDTNAPATWSWTDVQDVDIRIYGQNTNASSTRYLRIYRVWIDVYWENYGMRIYDDDGNKIYDTTRYVSRILYQGTIDASSDGAILIPCADPYGINVIEIYTYPLDANLDPPQNIDTDWGIYSIVVKWAAASAEYTFGDTEIIVLGR